MFGYALALIPILLLVGAGGWFYLYKTNSKFPSVVASLAVLAIVSAIFMPSSYAIAKNISQTSAVGNFKEYWNGWETAAVKQDTLCTKTEQGEYNGCSHTYSCDSYIEMVLKTKYRTIPDGNGGMKQQMYTTLEPETHWHQCPYSQKETDYSIKTTLGSSIIARNVMTGAPWSHDESIPGGRQGDPRRWKEVRDRTLANNPDPVTTVNSYDNYLLGSQTATFQRYEGLINEMRAANLLPALTSGVFDIYRANKMHAVGVDNSKVSRYVDDVARLNGALGSDLQGDLHVVFVKSDITYSPADYIETLMAYWQSAEMGKNSLSKNAIVVVLGVDGKKVVWSAASSGMPTGNSGLLIDIRELMLNKPLDDNLLGSPSYNIPTASTKHTQGALEGILWGDNAYQRVSMSADDENDEGMGYKYLMDSIEPSTKSLVVAGIISTIFGSIVIFLGMFALTRWNLTNRIAGRDEIF